MVIWRRTSDNPREVQDSTCEWGSASPGNATMRGADRRVAGNSDLFSAGIPGGQFSVPMDRKRIASRAWPPPGPDIQAQESNMAVLLSPQVSAPGNRGEYIGFFGPSYHAFNPGSHPSRWLDIPEEMIRHLIHSTGVIYISAGSPDCIRSVATAQLFTFTPHGKGFIYSEENNIHQGLPPVHPGEQPHTS